MKLFGLYFFLPLYFAIFANMQSTHSQSRYIDRITEERKIYASICVSPREDSEKSSEFNGRTTFEQKEDMIELYVHCRTM